LRKKNPLKNKSSMKRLNPFNAIRAKVEQEDQKKSNSKNAAFEKARTYRKDKKLKAAKKTRKDKYHAV